MESLAQRLDVSSGYLSRLFKKELGEEYPILGWAEGPIAEATDLRGMGKIMTDIFEIREEIKSLKALIITNNLGLRLMPEPDDKISKHVTAYMLKVKVTDLDELKEKGYLLPVDKRNYYVASQIIEYARQRSLMTL